MANTDIRVTADTSSAIASLKNLQGQLQKVGGDFEKFFNTSTQLSQRLGLALVAAGVATAAFADEIQDLASANEAATSEILALSRALSQNGGNAQQAGRIFQTLSNSIQEANQGNLKTVAQFQKLGISMQDLGNLSNTELRNKLIRNLADIQDPTERNAAAFQFFGRSVAGVDIRGLSAGLEEATQRYRQNEQAIQTAADAFDRVSGIVSDLRVSFAEAFQPVFRLIANMNVSVETLTTAWKILAIAMLAATSAAVVGGLIKVIGLLKTMNDVIGKNKLVTVVSLLITAGISMATFAGLTNDAAEAQDNLADATKDTADNTEKNRRSQDNLNAALEKELATLTKIREDLQVNLDTALRKYDIELASLSLSEDQKRVAQEQADIEQQAQTALLKLRQQFENLDADARARRQADYEKEASAIRATAEAQKAAVDARLRGIAQVRDALNQLQGFEQAFQDGSVRAFESVARYLADNSGYQERIDLEAKLAQVTQTRAILTQQLAQVSESDRAAVIKAITESTTSVDLLGKSFDQVKKEIVATLQAQMELGNVSDETVKKIVGNLQLQFTAIEGGARQLSNVNRRIADQSRTFEAGWGRAFRSYVDNATNASRRAEQIFSRMMSGLEDLLVNFVKTGEFSWKSFVNMMAEELLRSQIQQLFGSIMTGMQGLAGQGGILGSIAGLFGGGGSTKGQSANNPLYVIDVAGGGNPIAGAAQQIFGPPRSAMGGGGIGGVVSGVWDTVKSIGSSIGDFFGGFFANGGTLGAGKWGIAGENGPEIISGPATVTPMGGGTNVTYNINAVDAASFKALVASDPGFIHAVAMKGAGSIPMGR